MEKEKREGLLDSLSALAGSLDERIEEYEKRIEAYESLLNEVDNAIRELNNAEPDEDEEERDTPDEAMNSFLLDEEELLDEISEGRLNEGDGDTALKEQGIRALNRAISHNENLIASLRDADERSSGDMLFILKEILESAITEVKADYADILDNIRLLSNCYELLGEENED